MDRSSVTWLAVVSASAAVASAAATAWSAWQAREAADKAHQAAENSHQAAEATLALAKLERSDRIEAADTADYQRLEKELEDPTRLHMDKKYRKLFAGMTSPSAPLGENAFRVFLAGLECSHEHRVMDEEANRHLFDFYLGPVHKMVQLGFRNKGPEAAFGVDLEAAPTFLYLFMWRMGTSTNDDVTWKSSIPCLLARYNRTAGMARSCKTESIRQIAEQQLLSNEEATALFDRVIAYRTAK